MLVSFTQDKFCGRKRMAGPCLVLRAWKLDKSVLSFCLGFFQLPLLQVIEIALGNCQMFSLSSVGPLENIYLRVDTKRSAGSHTSLS